MIAPLAPDYREAVLWQEQVAPVAGGPAPPVPAEADVVVVGAGYAGLSAARELGVAGRSVLVVDAHPVGWGASTRNGGMVIPELKAGPEIPCDYARTGQLCLAHAARLVPGLEAAARDHAERGEPVRFVPRDALAAEIGSTAHHGAVVYERTGGLHPALARSVSPRHRMLVDTRNFLHYWRLTPDGRLLFGGRRSLSPSTIAEARDFLHAAMLRIHPQLAGVRVARTWGGDVAVTVDRMPHAGTVDGVWYASGCNGSGVALNTWLGLRIGRHLAGGDPPPSFAELRHRPIPLHRWRRAWLPAVGAWFRWQDRP
jgi:glycine/D-amino acid oxidase-like deaminating enzyme